MSSDPYFGAPAHLRQARVDSIQAAYRDEQQKRASIRRDPQARPSIRREVFYEILAEVGHLRVTRTA